MKNRFDFRFQIHSGHRLRHPIRHGRHPEHPHTLTPSLRDFHRFDRRREITPRRHTIPNPIQIPITVLFKLGNRHAVDSGRTLVGLDPRKRLPHNPLGNLKRFVPRLRFGHPTPPGQAG